MAQIYKIITADDRSFISQESTTGLWTGDTGSLSTFYTSATQIAKVNSNYFVDVYNADPATNTSAEVQFSIGYGNRFGSGSPTLTQDNTSTRSTQAVYHQLRNLLLEPTDTQFTFSLAAADFQTSNSIYAIVVSRARYKGYVDSGNWQLTLSGSIGSRTFIDDSSQTLGTKRSFAKNGLVFNVASGSLTGTQGSTIDKDTEGFGLFYPQKGIIILNADLIDKHMGFVRRTGDVNDTDFAHDNASPPGLTSVNAGENVVKSPRDGSATDFMTVFDAATTMPTAPWTGSLAGYNGVYSDQYNWHGLYRSMVLGAQAAGFQARSAEIISSNHYFLRLNNKEFNYSNNPSFASSSDDGQLANQDFENDPKVFVTTVGLYNNSNELLAVAKLSRPLEKSFSKEALLRVRLDF